VCVCVCVCARARARVRGHTCACECVPAHAQPMSEHTAIQDRESQGYINRAEGAENEEPNNPSTMQLSLGRQRGLQDQRNDTKS
jgi:hypothetical protein